MAIDAAAPRELGAVLRGPGLGALAATPAVAEQWEEKRYPDSRIVTLDKSFEKYLIREASVEKLHAGKAAGLPNLGPLIGRQFRQQRHYAQTHHQGAPFFPPSA